jgi:putative ABC transport system permease protein
MLGYYTRLAFRSFARSPGLTTLMVVAIGLGIAACVITLTIYHAMAGNPIPQKSNRLYAVTIDSWAAERPANRDRPTLPPTQLTYKDAKELFRSAIPERKVLMYPATGVVVGAPSQPLPMRLRARITTSDFFPMFDVPFQFGRAWDASADTGPQPVIVLSRELNQRLFGGENSVGSTLRWNNREFRVIGVLADWHPRPLFYDLNEGNFKDPEGAYVPWGWGEAIELRSSGSIRCWKFEDVTTLFAALLASECTFVQMWVELPNAAAVARMQAFVDAYWAEQHKAGRFARPRNNRLTTVDRWLVEQEVIQNDNRVLVQVAFAFLAVCLINTVGLLLAKFLNESTWAGVRRALGASRRQIFLQHFVEVALLSGAGALAGVVLGALGLWGVRTMYRATAEDAGGGYAALAHFDGASFGWAAALALMAMLVTGVYPAWRVGRLSPAVCLKSQ